MKYVIDKTSDELKLSYYNVNITGLSIEPKNGYPKVKYKASKMTIIDPDLSTAYIKKKINKKIDKLVEFMLKIILDEDTSEGDVGIVLDEVNRLKGIIFTKYKEHLKIEEYRALLSKIILLEEEFKKNYNQKVFMNSIKNQFVNNYYEEDMSEGRSR